ncbi:MAG: glycoside hydrolase family 13 protein, partial [Clostridia bacterium]|nr:glycoside hydrolase family 13 protein [Clostridia bacterium]
MSTRIPHLTPSISQLTGYVFYDNGDGYSKRTAYDLKKPIKLGLLLPRALGAGGVRVSLFNEREGSEKTYDLTWHSLYLDFDFYEITFDKNELTPALYFFNFIIKTAQGNIYGNRHGGNKVSFSQDKSTAFQLTAYKFKHRARIDKGGVIYQIFVDRFSKGQGAIKVDCAVYPDSFEVIPEVPDYPGAPMKNNTFYGGNLFGVIDRLDYLKSLSVTAIYLTPIFRSPSNHKYDTADYMKVDEGFGGDEALKELIEKAHALGIKIILDGVFNHTGADSVYFNKYRTYGDGGAYNSKLSPYYPWYDFKHYPEDYTSWWGIDILPRINPDIPECAEFFSGKGGVIDKYTGMGVDGFRLDVVDELPDTFIKSIKNRQQSINPGSILYGEVWEDASNKIAYGERKSYYTGDELDGVMNYPVRRGIIGYLTSGSTDALLYAIDEVYNNAPKRIADTQMNLLGTHDTERILTVLGGINADGYSKRDLSRIRMSEEEKRRAKTKLIMAYAILATLPGIPMIYYGDEVGLEGYSDPCNRLPYPYGKEDTELLRAFCDIGALRAKNSVYKNGKIELLYIDSELLAYRRIGNKY